MFSAGLGLRGCRELVGILALARKAFLGVNARGESAPGRKRIESVLLDPLVLQL